MKKCTNKTCEVEGLQSLDNFSKNSAKKDGLNHMCRSCEKRYRDKTIERRKEYSKTYYNNNSTYFKEYTKKTYQKDPEKHRAQQKINYKKNKNNIKEYNKDNAKKFRNNHLIRNYNISSDDYDLMFQNQKSLCKICHQQETAKNKSLAVDHCHETGEIRGLLCNNCNKGLGNFKDNITNLYLAIQYLSKENS